MTDCATPKRPTMLNLDDIVLEPIELDGFQLDLDSIDLDPSPPPDSSPFLRPKIHSRRMVRSKYAADLVEQIGAIGFGESVFSLISGRFIFGDFIRLFIEKHEINVLEARIATLSMSEENIGDLAGLMRRDFIQKLDLHVSVYFWSHERHNMIPMIADLFKAEIEAGKFNLVVSATHCKVATIKTEGGRHLTLHGSANLRSSDNVEQVEIVENKELHDFNADLLDTVKERYNITKKPVRGESAWQ